MPEEDTAVSVRVHPSHGEKDRKGEKRKETERAGSSKQRSLQAFRNMLHWVFDFAGASKCCPRPTEGPHSCGGSIDPTARPALHTMLAPVPRVSLWVADGRVLSRVFPLFLLFLLDMRADKTETHHAGGLHAGLCCVLHPQTSAKGHTVPLQCPRFY